MSDTLEVFLPVLRKRLSLYVPRKTYLVTCAFIGGYQMGSDDDTFDGFHDWMVSRGSGRPELAWPWLVLTEIYPPDKLPSPAEFTEDEDRIAIELLFDLLEHYYAQQTPLRRKHDFRRDALL